MKIDRKGLKAQAKQAIRAAAPVFWLVTLLRTSRLSSSTVLTTM